MTTLGERHSSGFERVARIALAVLAMGWLPGHAQTAPAAPQPATSQAATRQAASGPYRIAGKVVNAVSGEPVRHATVAVLTEATSHTFGSVVSDNEGYFAVDRLPGAKYQLTASKRGFRTAFYDEHEDFSTAIVTGPDQDTEHLVFRLMPGATLFGTITGDGGDPVEGAKVMLFRKEHDHAHEDAAGERVVQAESAVTDDTGAYEFSNLAAGQYLLGVKAEPWYAMTAQYRGPGQSAASDSGPSLDVAFPVTFFDSTTDEAGAAPIVLAQGGREEANVSMHAVPAIHLQVQAPRKQNESIARPELRQTVFGIPVSAESAGFFDAMHTGSTEFRGVAPGHYELMQGDPQRVVELDATASQQVDPNSGTQTGSIVGTLKASGGSTVPDQAAIALRTAAGSGRQDQLGAYSRKGQFRFDSVTPGSWELWVEASGRELPVLSTIVDGKVHAGNLVTVKDQPLTIVAIVSQGETTIQGFAHKGDKGFPGAMVVLVPKDHAAFQALVRRDQSDSDGSFVLRNVGPGQYTVVAIEDGWDLDWARAEVIERYLPAGVAVTVTEASGKLVQLASPVAVGFK
jgi:hypothetical protein